MSRYTRPGIAFVDLHIVLQKPQFFLSAAAAIRFRKCAKFRLNPCVLISFVGKAFPSARNNPSDSFFISVHVIYAVRDGASEVIYSLVRRVSSIVEILNLFQRSAWGWASGGLVLPDRMQNDPHLAIREPNKGRYDNQSSNRKNDATGAHRLYLRG